MRGIIIFLLFFGGLIWADTVILENDSVYEGRIVKETEKMIIIKTEIGEIGIPRDKIKEIEYEWVKEGEKEYKKGNWEEAKEIFEEYIEKEKGKTKDKEKAIFKIGMCYMKLNEKEKALKKFLQLLKEYPDTEYREKAELEIGKIYYEKGEKEKAKEIFEKLKGSWDRKIKAEAEYYLFVLNPPETEGEKEEFYNEYIAQYPESPYISEILYQKGETLYNRIENREKYTIKNIPQYREIKELREEAKEKTENPETLKKIYPLLITCYDHLAEYRRKHKTMREYVDLLYPKDKEKQANYLKKQADELKEKGETGEAIMLYHFIPYNYPESKTVSGCYFKLGELFEEKMDWERALKNYKFVLSNEVEENLLQKVLFRIGICYLKLNKNKKATEMFQEIILKYPESNFSGEVLYYLGRAYYNSGRKEKAKEVFNRYFKKFPEGKYAKEVNLYLKLP